MQQLETNALFTQYLNVVNRSMGENRDKMPYKLMFNATNKLLEDDRIGVAVYKSDAKNPHDWFTITLHDGSFEIVDHGKKDPKVTWKVKQDHLQNVVEHPDEFVKHPMKLDLDWLRTRLGAQAN